MIFQKKYYFSHVSYKSLAFGALILGSIVNADKMPMDLCYRCYK